VGEPPVSEEYIGQGPKRDKPKVMKWIKSRQKMINTLESLRSLKDPYYDDKVTVDAIAAE
jgi:hypothetical protein